jgi:hypothetical protein
MALTNELKRSFQGLHHTYKYFKGIRFKKGFSHYGTCTDVQSVREMKGEDDNFEDSPPLPIFDDDNLV